MFYADIQLAFQRKKKLGGGRQALPFVSKWFLESLGISQFIERNHWSTSSRSLTGLLPSKVQKYSLPSYTFSFIDIEALICLGNMGIDGKHLVMSFSSRGWEFYPRKLPSLVLNCSKLLSRSSNLKQVEPDVDILVHILFLQGISFHL